MAIRLGLATESTRVRANDCGYLRNARCVSAVGLASARRPSQPDLVRGVVERGPWRNHGRPGDRRSLRAWSPPRRCCRALSSGCGPRESYSAGRYSACSWRRGLTRHWSGPVVAPRCAGAPQPPAPRRGKRHGSRQSVDHGKVTGGWQLNARSVRRRVLSHVDVCILESAEAVAVKAADVCADLIHEKPDARLGLATGTTPQALYAELIRRNRLGHL